MRKKTTKLKQSAKRPIEILTDNEMEALIAATGKGKAGIRDRALIMVMWRCQLRVDEALELRPKDVSPQQVRVLHGKGDKSRIAASCSMVWSAVELWKAERTKCKMVAPSKKPLFCVFTKGREGGKMDDRQVRAMLKRCADRAGIEKRVHPHGLRHTGASMLVNSGGDLPSISQQLGHSHLVTTERYLHTINPQERLRKITELLERTQPKH